MFTQFARSSYKVTQDHQSSTISNKQIAELISASPAEAPSLQAENMCYPKLHKITKKNLDDQEDRYAVKQVSCRKGRNS